MIALIEKLKRFIIDINLEERFSDDFETPNHIFSNQEKNSLNKQKNIYRRNLRLKEIIKNKANGSYDLTDLNFWIINNWGGINTFKANDNNFKKIKTFSDELKKGKLTRKNFETISSLSKLSSFINPDEYVIYDSRVIYVLNWLILTTENDLKYFPMPNSRNKRLVDFDINTLIYLINFDKYSNNEIIFYDYHEAYFIYCSLMKSLSQVLYNTPNIKPYILEMLLFSIADVEIFNEITQWTKIEIIEK